MFIDSNKAASTPSLTETNVTAAGELDRSDVFRELDDQIALMNASISNLKMRRNALAPISRLPPEILTEVLSCVITRDQTEWSSGDLHWVQLLTVCRRWHSVMMESPRLWSLLVFANIAGTAEMLRRSKSSPLVIKADFGLQKMEQDAFELAWPHLSRIRVLHVRGPAELLERLFHSMSQCAPLLESFCWVVLYSREPVIFPPFLLEDATPRLRHFAIRNLDVPWELPLLKGLTHLEIVGLRGALAPNLARFRDVLSCCPALCTLILSCTLPNASEVQDLVQVPISLPKLSRLSFEGPAADCVTAVRNISFPPTTLLRLSLILHDALFPPEFRHLLSDLVSRCECSVSITRLSLIFRGSSSISFKAWNSTAEFPPETPSINISFERSFTSLADPPVFFDFLIWAIRESLHFTGLETLDMDVLDVPGAGDDLWLTVAGCRWKELRTLKVTTLDVNGLLSALKPMPKQGVETLAVHLPRLQELVLRGVVFERSDFEGLQECLILRRESGAEIERLRLIDCYRVRNSDMDRLKQIVVDAEWDGIQQNGLYDDWTDEYRTVVTGYDWDEGDYDYDDGLSDDFTYNHSEDEYY